VTDPAPRGTPSPTLADLAAAALAILRRDGHREAGTGAVSWRATFQAKSGLAFEISCAGPDLPASVEPAIASGAQIFKERSWTGTYRLVVRAARQIVLDLYWKTGEPTRVMGFSRGDWEFDLVAMSLVV
jgi:hypothetical protein